MCATQAAGKTLCYIAKRALRVRLNRAHANTSRTAPPDRACATEDPSRGSGVARGNVQNGDYLWPAGRGDRAGRDVHRVSEDVHRGDGEDLYGDDEPRWGECAELADAGEVREPGRQGAGKESEFGAMGGRGLSHDP